MEQPRQPQLVGSGTTVACSSANANALLFMLLSACFGLGMMASILVAQSLGARDIDHAKRVIGTAAVFFAGVSLAMAIIGATLAPTILRLMHTPPDSLPLAAAYLRVIFVALPGMYLYSLLTMVLRGAGDSRTPFAFMLVSAALDVGLNPLLILGIGPFPRLGIAGSALSRQGTSDTLKRRQGPSGALQLAEAQSVDRMIGVLA